MIAVYIAAALLVASIVFLLALPKTNALRLTRKVPVPAEKLFATLTDLQAAPRWIPHCTAAIKTGGRDSAARKQRVSYDENGARRDEEQLVTTWVDNRQYGWKLSPPTGSLADARTVVTLTARGAETEVEILGEWTAAGLFAKLPAKFGETKRLREHYEGMLSRLESVR
jgi:uncharacterized protein YndB with AHSA1/START domain